MAKKQFSSNKGNRDKKWDKDSRNSQARKGRRCNTSASDRAESGEKYYDDTSKPSMKNPNVKQTSRANDASWYTYSSDILRVAAAVNFNQAIGVPFSEEAIEINQTGDNKNWWPTAPSVMALSFTPLPGMTLATARRNATNAPVNLQLRSLYSMIQATVTQNLPFAAADLGIHTMFMDSVFTMWGHMQRFYYLYRVYKAMNRTLPDAFFKAYHMNRSTIENDHYTIADYQADMLTMQQEMRRIAVPDGFDIMNRHYWMSKHVFKDDDVVRAQLYMFVPDALWQFDAEGATGGELKLVPIPSFESSGMEGMMIWFKNFLRSYYNDENIWNLNGYLLRAFSKFWIADDFQLDGIYEPAYVPEVLMQIHNANPVGHLLNSTSEFQGDYTRIFQDSQDNIRCNPAGVISDSPVYYGPNIDNRILFDMPTDTPTDGDIMVASRLIARGFPYAPTGTDLQILPLLSFGTEVINVISIYDGWNDSNSPEIIWGIKAYSRESDGTVSIGNRRSIDMARISKFGSAPLFPVVTDDASLTVSDWKWLDYMGDIRNFVVFDRDVLSKLHDAAAMGEWFIKQ